MINMAAYKVIRNSGGNIAQRIKLTTDKDRTYDLSKLKIRYYYTSDSEAAQNAYIDTASI